MNLFANLVPLTEAQIAEARRALSMGDAYYLQIDPKPLYLVLDGGIERKVDAFLAADPAYPNGIPEARPSLGEKLRFEKWCAHEIPRIIPGWKP